MRCRARLLAGAGLVVAVVVAGASPAFAHAQLQSTDPAAGAALSHSPGRVILHFDESVEIQFGAIRVFNSSAKRVDSGASYHPSGDGRAVGGNVPGTLPDGGYVVTWRVISADSHPVHGAFTFRIGPASAAGATSTKDEAAKLLSAGGGSAVVGGVFAAVRSLAFLSLLVLIGAAAFVAVAWPAGGAERRTRRLIWSAWGAAIVSTALSIALQGPYGAGLPIANAVKPSVLSAVVHTRYGEVTAVRLVVLILAGMLLRILFARGLSAVEHDIEGGSANKRDADRPPDRLPARWLLLGTLVAFITLGATAFAGHSGVGSQIALALPVDLAHLGAAAVWLGGLAVLAVVLLPAAVTSEDAEAERLEALVPRFSQWAFGAVVALVVTAAYLAWRQVGTLAAVTGTSYGRLLLAKTIGFAVMLGVASFSRRLVHGDLGLPVRLRPVRQPPRPPLPAPSRGTRAAVSPVRDPAPGPTVAPAPEREPAPGPAVAPGPTAAASPGPGPVSPGPGAVAANPGRARLVKLRWAVIGELLVGAVVVALTALLVNAQPARAALARPYSTEVKAGNQLLVDVVVDPARAGPLTLHLYVLTSDGAQADVPEVKATLTLPSAGIDPIQVPLQKAGVGHFLVYGLDVPIRGTWTLQMLVRTSAIDEVNADVVKVPIR